jgi:hypothetical protein
VQEKIVAGKKYYDSRCPQSATFIWLTRNGSLTEGALDLIQELEFAVSIQLDTHAKPSGKPRA